MTKILSLVEENGVPGFDVVIVIVLEIVVKCLKRVRVFTYSV